MNKSLILWIALKIQKQVRLYKMQYVLNTGETAVASRTGEIVCFGLGSCVGVFLYDKFKKVGAAAHIMLPANNKRPHSDQMFDTIVNRMISLGCDSLTIRAKLVGGADIMKLDAYNIGQRNIEYVKKKLKAAGIMILTEDVLGTESRTARLDIESGVLSIRNSNKKHYTI